MIRQTVSKGWFPKRRGCIAARSLVALSSAALLSACQSLIEQTYEPTVSPSSNPQIVEEVQKNDPRAQLGAREHPRIVASYGGEYRDAKTERLVARITGALTAVSENPQQSYRITILNSPAINAFALPGGYLYVTRGLLALADDASEVAAVLSHEMAHVTANHGIQRQQREEAEVIASRVVAEVLSSNLAGKQALARGKLRLAAFSRNQELQADVIGVRMLGEAGYDPYAAARFLDSMAAYARFTAVDPESDQSLDFLSSHPNAPQRVELARRHARAFGPEGTSGDRGRDYYLAGIDGLLYGDSPQEGYVRGQTFLHGKLGIRFDVPTGFQIDNKAEAVLATGPGDVAIRFDGVADTARRSLTDYLASGWVTGLQPDTIKSVMLNGLEAATAYAS
ncbi:MAG TPA: M48 family metalloprotease, partial [Sinorhizobium sp.]|nr:M48 family metalloprotease [Sinorhizobium sp.]